MNSLEAVKTIHVTCVVLSFTGFFIRGIWMMQRSPNLKLRWVRITPHVVDTLLLGSAIMLAVQMYISPLEHSWLMTKIIALLVYIGIGTVALREGRSKQIRVSAWLLGLVTFMYIVSVAFTKSVMGWFALF
jgi:uncharacterized membrane protein SirB2